MSDKPNDPMKSIWDATAIAYPNGKTLIRWTSRNDLVYLYDIGFVDTDQFSPEQWIKSFEDSLQKDFSYLVTEEQWMAKRSYRYEGPTELPFNPLTMREGEWEPAELDAIVYQKILPSTTLKKEHFDYFVYGHRHYPLVVDLGERSKYVNLGDWIKYFSYAEWDGEILELKYFEK